MHVQIPAEIPQRDEVRQGVGGGEDQFVPSLTQFRRDRGETEGGVDRGFGRTVDPFAVAEQPGVVEGEPEPDRMLPQRRHVRLRAGAEDQPGAPRRGGVDDQLRLGRPARVDRQSHAGGAVGAIQRLRDHRVRAERFDRRATPVFVETGGRRGEVHVAHRFTPAPHAADGLAGGDARRGPHPFRQALGDRQAAGQQRPGDPLPHQREAVEHGFARLFPEARQPGERAVRDRRFQPVQRVHAEVAEDRPHLLRPQSRHPQHRPHPGGNGLPGLLQRCERAGPYEFGDVCGEILAHPFQIGQRLPGGDEISRRLGQRLEGAARGPIRPHAERVRVQDLQQIGQLRQPGGDGAVVD